MHPNPAFRGTPRDANLEFARTRGFGTLCANGADGPILAHVPFLLSENGAALELHLVRSNPLLKLLPGPVVMAAQSGLFLAAMTVLSLWSIAGIWRFPDLWPEGLSLSLWTRGDWLVVALRSLWLGLASVELALALAVAVLEGEHRSGRDQAGFPALRQSWQHLPWGPPQ